MFFIIKYLILEITLISTRSNLFKQDVQLDPIIEHSRQGSKHFSHFPDRLK
jgi:hypothetical protein